MLLQTNSYIVPKEKRAEHARLMRRFRQILNRIGCDDFEIYEQVGANWGTGQTSGRFVQIMRFRDRKHQLAVQNAERSDPAAQQLIAEFCELIDYPAQTQQQQFAIGFYSSVLPVAPVRAPRAEQAEEIPAETGGENLAAAAAVAETAEFGESQQEEPQYDAVLDESAPVEGEQEQVEPAEQGAQEVEAPVDEDALQAEPEDLTVAEEQPEEAELSAEDEGVIAEGAEVIAEEETAPEAATEEAGELSEDDLLGVVSNGEGDLDHPTDAPANGEADLSIEDDNDDISRLAEELASDEGEAAHRDDPAAAHRHGRGSENGAR